MIDVQYTSMGRVNMTLATAHGFNIKTEVQLHIFYLFKPVQGPN